MHEAWRHAGSRPIASETGSSEMDCPAPLSYAARSALTILDPANSLTPP